MKPTRFISLLVFCTVFFAHAYAQSADDVSIRKLLEDDIKSFHNFDVKSWSNNRLHDPGTSLTSIRRSGFFTVKSWDSLSAAVNNYMSTAPKLKPVNVNLSDVVIRADGNVAWADYTQVLTSASSDTSFSDTTHETRMLVKDSDNWKIAKQITTGPGTWKMPYTAAQIENQINESGYALMGANRLQDAIELFKLNIKLHPNAWNPYDSLGEAYAAAGDKQKAIENYEMSVKLNPKNDIGKAILEKLKQ